MVRSYSGAELQGACASERRLTGRTREIALDTARHEGLDHRLRLSTAELEQLKRANEGLATELVARKRAEHGLEEACRRRDEFLATLAHELRNPLNAIQSGMAILGGIEAASETAEVARGTIGRQLRNMRRLIDDLLDVSRITQGKLPLEKEPVNFATAVELAIQTCLPLIMSRRHDIEMNVPDEPILIDVDPGRLEQVLTNLLNNAAKYTEPGGRLRLSVSLEGGQAVLRMKDTGIGMTGETLSRIFDLFVQADRSLHRSQGGLGIGLTLVKSLVEMHGGTVTAESEGIGKGSEFTVRLPASSGLPGAPPLGKARHPRGQRLRILVVDGNRDATDTMALLLKLSGHDVRAAYRGDEALAAAREFLPEVVLLDIGLPGMDACLVARRLRAEKDLAQVCLIAASGYGDEEDWIRSREAGFDHHLTKPITLNLVKALLSACVSHGRGPVERPQAAYYR